MGHGRGVDIKIVLKVIELILLIVSVVLLYIEDKGYSNYNYLSRYRKGGMPVHDSLCVSCSVYVILLGIILLLHFIKGIDQDEKFMGYLSAAGAILLVACGICVCIKAENHNDLLISGIIGIVGGVCLLIDCLKDFKVF